MNLWDRLFQEGGIFIPIRMALILVITFLIAGLARQITKRTRSDRIIFRFVRNVINVAIYLVGISLALNQLPGFNVGLQTLLAGSGIAALAIGLAAQESLGNAINGVVMTISKPFEAGDRIRLVNADITGYVENITLRHTVIRTFMNSRIIVPNSLINKDLIENSNFHGAKASAFIDVIIRYDADLEEARRIMAEVVEGHPDFVDPRSPDEMHLPKVEVYVRSLGVYGVELRTSMWTENVGMSFAACSEVRRRVKHAFDQAGIEFATGFAALPPG